MKLLLTCIVFLSSAALADVSKLVNKVDSAVVVLRTSERAVNTQAGISFEISSQGLGTGVIVDKEGHIVTAAHVVQIADEVIAEFSDGTQVPAKVVNSDPRLDLALLRLESVPDSVKPVKLGDSDKLPIGSDVVVIGSPYGLAHSVSKGIVSGKYNPPEELQNLIGASAEIIQTDAAINQGNSGGPMFNRKGEVVGIVSFILSQSGGFDGIGFAVSSNTAKEALFENPMFWSGLEIVPVAGDFARALNLNEPGLLVQKVADGSVADQLGLKAGRFLISVKGNEILLGGDVIVAFDGVDVKTDNINEIRTHMKQLQPNDTLQIGVRRAGRLLVLKTKLPANK